MKIVAAAAATLAILLLNFLNASLGWVHKGPYAERPLLGKVLNTFTNRGSSTHPGSFAQENEERIISGISTHKPKYEDFRFKCTYSRVDKGLLICACGSAKIGVRTI